MYLSLDNRANINASVSVRAEGVPTGTHMVNFSTSNGDYGDISASSGSASWYFSSPREGVVSVTAAARDESGATIDSASASVTLVDPYAAQGAVAASGQDLRGFEDIGRFGLTGDRQPVCGRRTTYTIINIPDGVHSLVIECHVGNGGIKRFYPRGRKSMTFEAAFAEPKETYITVIARDVALHETARVLGRVTPVAQAQADAAGLGAQPPADLGVTGITSVPPMGVDKPPVAFVSAKTASQGPAPQATPASVAAGQLTSYPGSTGLSDIQKDMQARTDALLNRLTKR